MLGTYFDGFLMWFTTKEIQQIGTDLKLEL